MSKIDNVIIIQQGNALLYFGYKVNGEIKNVRKLTDKEYLELYSYFNYNLSVEEKIKKYMKGQHKMATVTINKWLGGIK